MLNRRINKRIIIVSLTAILAMTMVVPVFASSDRIPYSFLLRNEYHNSYTEGRYRQTTNVNNKWMVDMTYHSDGSNAQATYWLARTGDKTRVSDTHKFRNGTGSHFYAAYASGSQCNVCLGCENAKRTSANVAGYWDEETL